ncbi:hypothetical protein GCM10009547_48070 [Sporichthya brevicatena]|uniref:Uncharacterized protein n=1 Tax=Sporichthya brevicatena TaxID=171442 RepID=A0ABN1HCI9_9ACTN
MAGARGASSRVWAASLLLLAVILTLTGTAGTASAAAGPAFENRVKALDAAVISGVGLNGDIGAGQRRGDGLPQLRLAVGRGVHTYYVILSSVDGASTGTAVLVHKTSCPTGLGVGDAPSRIAGPWSRSDLQRGAFGQSPRGLGSPHLHHADQMPGSAIHEVNPQTHRLPGVHPSGAHWSALVIVMIALLNLLSAAGNASAVSGSVLENRVMGLNAAVNGGLTSVIGCRSSGAGDLRERREQQWRRGHSS